MTRPFIDPRFHVTYEGGVSLISNIYQPPEDELPKSFWERVKEYIGRSRLRLRLGK